MNVYPNVVLEINTNVISFRLAMIGVKRIRIARAAVAVRASVHMRLYALNQPRNWVIPVTRISNASQVHIATMEIAKLEH